MMLDKLKAFAHLEIARVMQALLALAIVAVALQHFGLF
jgi:hypothetical protein